MCNFVYRRYMILVAAAPRKKTFNSLYFTPIKDNSSLITGSCLSSHHGTTWCCSAITQSSNQASYPENLIKKRSKEQTTWECCMRKANSEWLLAVISTVHALTSLPWGVFYNYMQMYTSKPISSFSQDVLLLLRIFFPPSLSGHNWVAWMSAICSAPLCLC